MESKKVQDQNDPQQPAKKRGCCKKKEKPNGPEMLPFFKLFQHCTRTQKFLVGLGILMGLICGGVSPAVAVVMGKVIFIFDPKYTSEEVNEMIIELLKFIAVLSSVLWVTGYMQYALLQHVAEQISFDLRAKYLDALMRQEIEFFERQQVEALPSQISEYFEAISSGVGEKIGQVCNICAMCIGGFILAFYYGPIFTLICLGYMPLMAICIMQMGKNVKEAQGLKLKQVEKLGGHTEEALSAIKLVQSFAQEDVTINKYDKICDKTQKIATKAAILQGSIGGMFLFLMFGFFLYSYAMGSLLLEKNVINPSTMLKYTIFDIVTVSQATLMSIMSFGGIIPIIPGIIKALVMGKKVMDVINRVPSIVSSEHAEKNIQLNDSIKFKDVHFKYPTAVEKSRPTFQGVDFEIKAGTSTAIVGPSGSGKSTIVQLINRFYDPKQGSIHFDETDLKKISLHSLREAIGYVSQEPVLILGTIRENLMYGNKDATEEDIENVLRMANASFVHTFENGLDSYVGAGSVMNLSGGQKQRIAIARALIKKPKILVLDEATSALDSKSEKEVQDAIENIRIQQGSSLTIIMIAHRLSTISTAEHLIHLQEPTKIVGAAKGSQDYSKIMNELRKSNYKHQVVIESPEVVTPEEKDRDELALVAQSLTVKVEDGASSVRDENEEKGLLVLFNNKTEKKKEVLIKNAGFFRIMQYYKPVCSAVSMVLCACINSLSFPILGLLISFYQYVLQGYETAPDYVEMRNRLSILWAILCVILGGIAAIEKSLFGVTGETLTAGVRKDLIRAVIYKQLNWFDDERRAPGVLSSYFSEDVACLNGLSTETMSTLVEAICGLVLGVCVALYFCWQQALLTICCSPIILIGVIAMSRLNFGNKRGKQQGEKKQADVYEKASALMSDVIFNYRTVISLGDKNVKTVVKKFEDLLIEPNRKRVRNAHIAGIFFGYSTAARIVFIGLVFWIGTQVIKKWGYEARPVYISIWVLFSACMGSGFAMSNVPSASKARAAAQRIFAVVDEKSTLDVRQASESSIQEVTDGLIEFKDVYFKYPSRKNQILDNFNLTIPATYKIALVGSSGCGKTTLTSLLLRFYEVESGQILIDGHDIKDYNVSKLRTCIGYVMQEPILFNQSIKENILYGKLDATDTEVRRAALLSNSMTFIETNDEDLDKEEKFAKQKEQLVAKINELKEKYFGIAILDFKIQKRSSSVVELMLEVLSRCDEAALKRISKESELFLATFNDECEKKGSKWDDLIINFEWTFEMQQLMKTLKQDKLGVVQQCIQYFMYQFDRETVSRWLNEGSDLSQVIKEDQERIRHSRFKRTEELIDNYLEMTKGDGKLHANYGKICGLKGSKLSGGQKQRIAIARALIKNPKILVLDEATSALDEHSQEIVQQALDRAMEGRTSIVIAHRLSTIRNCQILFVLNNGVVCESGTFEELSANKESHFYKLKSGMEM